MELDEDDDVITITNKAVIFDTISVSLAPQFPPFAGSRSVPRSIAETILLCFTGVFPAWHMIVTISVLSIVALNLPYVSWLSF